MNEVVTDLMGKHYRRKGLNMVDRDRGLGRGTVMMNMGGEGDEMRGKREGDKVRGRMGLSEIAMMEVVIGRRLIRETVF